MRTRLSVFERRACRVLGQHRSTQRRIPRGRDDEALLVADMVKLARRYGRYGYRRITALLRQSGWHVNDKRVERLWRREELKVPVKQPKLGRLWFTMDRASVCGQSIQVTCDPTTSSMNEPMMGRRSGP